MHMYIHMHIFSHTQVHTYRHKVLPTLYDSCYLVLSSYHKSYQQYFDILLNYTKSENYCCRKNKNINK